jgi:hypothetical protein
MNLSFCAHHVSITDTHAAVLGGGDSGSRGRELVTAGHLSCMQSAHVVAVLGGGDSGSRGRELVTVCLVVMYIPLRWRVRLQIIVSKSFES